MTGWSIASHAQAPDVQKLLATIKAQDKGQLAVSEEDGRFLRVLIATSKAKRALEIGGASGYSAIWIGMGLRETGGTLVTMEYDPVRAKELAENIKRAAATEEEQTDPGTVADVHYDFTQFGLDRSQGPLALNLRTSLIVDPRDGRIPPMTAEGLRRAAERAESRKRLGPLDAAQGQPAQCPGVAMQVDVRERRWAPPSI